MLTAEQREIARMQDELSKEREKSYRPRPEPPPQSQPNNYRPGTRQLLHYLKLPPFTTTPGVAIHQKKQEAQPSP
jgi:hypothetical protein